MARLTAGIFSIPSGHNNGLVFGKARTADGKKTTVREYVKPTNPNTTAQQNQRSKFRYAVDLVKPMVPQLNTIGWNGAIKTLPAYQSLISLFVQKISNSTGKVTQPDSVSLGNLFHLPNLSAADGTGAITVTWDSTSGPHSDDADTVHIVAFKQIPAASGNDIYSVVINSDTTRIDGTAAVGSSLATGDYLLFAWAESNTVGIDPSSKYSEAEFASVTLA